MALWMSQVSTGLIVRSDVSASFFVFTPVCIFFYQNQLSFSQMLSTVAVTAAWVAWGRLRTTPRSRRMKKLKARVNSIWLYCGLTLSNWPWSKAIDITPRRTSVLGYWHTRVKVRVRLYLDRALWERPPTSFPYLAHFDGTRLSWGGIACRFAILPSQDC